MKKRFALALFILCIVPHISSSRGKIEQGFATYNSHEPGLKASHAYLAFGTRVRITNQNNDKDVIVTINGRIPHDTERTVHVGRAAAENIGLASRGKNPVTIEVLGRPYYYAAKN
jgi:rare lipoprotein A